MIFDGRNGGTVELLENVLIIRRKGVASFLTQGLKGEKRIPFSSIKSVQFKEAGFTTGYIQFGIAGGIESGRGVWDATTDENTVLFTKEAAGDFRRLRDLVEERAAAARSGGGAPISSAATPNVAEELTRLADLRDRGVLTNEEFAQQKSRLLGTESTGTQPPPSIPAPSTAAVARLRAGAESARGSVAEPRKGKFGKIAGIGCLAVIAIFVILAMIGSKVEQTAGAGNSTDPVGNSSSDEGSTSAAELPIAVTATELFRAYDNNEASAQGYFGGRKLLVSGTVDKVTLDFMDDPVVGLHTPNEFMSAQAALADDAKGQAASFSPGDKVKLLCENISEVAGTPMLKDCRRAPTGIKSAPVEWAKN